MRTVIIAFSILLISTGLRAQTRPTGEVSVGGGYGHIDPYEASLRLDVDGRKVSFRPFFGIKGITPYSSRHIGEEDYTFTGKAPLSENAGNQYLSSSETQAKGIVTNYGFNLGLKLSRKHFLGIEFEGENLSRNESGSLKEQFMASGKDPVRTNWTISNPLVNENMFAVGADYRFSYSPKGKLQLRYNFKHQDEAEEKLLESIELQGFKDFSKSQVNADAKIDHHNLVLALNHRFAKLDLGFAARYENRLIRSNDVQRLDGKITLEDHFRHSYQTGAVRASANYLPVKSLKLFAEFEYAYTDMQGRSLNDFLPKAAVEWRPTDIFLLALRYDRLLVRPDFKFLNPAEIREPFALRQGNEDIVGLHINKASFTFDCKLPVVALHLDCGYSYSDDGINGIWIEKGNLRLYQWGNDGIRHAWNISPSVKITPAKTTEINALATFLWDIRIADSINMSHGNWGYSAHLDLKQGLPAGFGIKIFGDYSFGNTLDLYRRAGTAFNVGGSLEKDFGKSLNCAIEGRFIRFGEEFISQGAYTGLCWLRPEHRFSVGLKLRYIF